MRLKTGLGLAFSAAVLSLSTPAAASIKQFTLTGDASMVFSIDDSVAPDLSDGSNFTYQGVSAIINGSAQAADFIFYSSGLLGGYAAFPYDLLGAQLYSGSASDPTFLTGTFSLTDFNQGLYSLTITEASATPEPSTWAMLIIGFGAVGMTVRRRRRAVQPAIA